MSTDPRSVLTSPAPPPDATLAYGPLPDQVVDLRLPAVRPSTRPAGAGPAPHPPLVVLIHGGFWRAAYDRAHVGPMAADLAARGWPVAVVEYRRTGAPGGGWPGTFDDVAGALARVPGLVARECAARGVPAPDPGGPVLVGHSAGGHLALWLAGVAPTAVRGVLALAPVADLAAAYELDLDGGAVGALLGGGPADVPDRYAAADPAARPSAAVSTVLLHGDRDAQVPISLSRRYAEAARRADRPVRLVELPGAEHFGLINPRSNVWNAVTDALRSVAGRSTGIDAWSNAE